MANVILSTLGTGGDVYPFLSLGIQLRARGHRVTLVTNAIYADAAQHAGIGFAPIDNRSDADEMIRDGQLLNNSFGLMLFFHRHILPRIVPEIEAIRALWRCGETVLVARVMPCIGAATAAEMLKIPLIGVALAPAHINGLSVFIELLNSSLGAEINSLRIKHGLNRVDNWDAWFKFARILGFWPEWFAEDRDYSPASLRTVGFLPAGEIVGSECDSLNVGLLRKSEMHPPILISCGTGYFGVPNFIRLAVEGCYAAGCKPVVVCRTTDLIPQDLPPDTVILNHVHSLPHLMRHMAAVCHHGGMGIISDAIFAGIPQIVIASGGDRPDNARRLSPLGVACCISPQAATREAVSKAIRAVVSSSSIHSKCRSLSSKMDTLAVLRESCEIVDGVVSEIL
ncbi:MAG: glycosyltransferase family 1 protein [Acidobacteria bacterium]|nr:glycosyltransferase family 1 protein [Acidobacteriota bacterium]